MKHVPGAQSQQDRIDSRGDPSLRPSYCQAKLGTALGEEGSELSPVVTFVIIADVTSPMLCISNDPRSDGDAEKDTLSNVKETGEFVVDIVSLSFSNTVHESSKNIRLKPTSPRGWTSPRPPAKLSKLPGSRRPA